MSAACERENTRECHVFINKHEGRKKEKEDKQNSLSFTSVNFTSKFIFRAMRLNTNTF